MHWNIGVLSILLCMILTVYGHRTLFETKCKRNCNTVYGSLACWTETTDGFAYGLATAMIDFCQVIFNIRNLNNDTENWLNTSRTILTEQIEQYSLKTDVKQLTKKDIEQVAISLLESCINASSPVILSEPPCPFCTEEQIQAIKRWGISSLVILSIGVLIVFIILFLYAFYNYYTNRSYMPLS